MSELASVWTPASLVSAIVGGVGIGYFVIGQILRNPRYSSGQASAVDVAKLVIGSAAIVGATFYVGQILSTFFEAGENLAWRIISRFTLWLLYALCLGVGAAWSVHNDEQSRYLKARDRARRVIERKR